MPIESVKYLCQPSNAVTSDSLVEQVASLEGFSEIRGQAREFFRRNHFTEGLERLVRRGFERLAGKSDDGAFYLTQAMGGGKTHSLIAFGLLASDPELRREIVPNLTTGEGFAAARVVIFNGHQNPDNLLWGHIADKLGRGEVMTPFWQKGARTPGVDEWVATLGNDPVLILLDELPSYIQMAQGEPVGNSTLGDLTIGALERLFNALPRCPRACVVVTNLKDDVYQSGSAQVRTLIESLTKHYDRNAQAITPVQQNTGEIFEIIRKKLFDALPTEDKIDAVAQAYVEALQKAKRTGALPIPPESYIARIRETYPFHPSIRDIVARFAENKGYQKTRALIRLLRHAVRGAMTGHDTPFLIGLHHLDFADQAVLEEIAKINPTYGGAIAKDIADRGNALAERIDAAEGSGTASAVAKMLLMSSLSAAENPIRGLTEAELAEFMVHPLLDLSEVKGALTAMQGQAWYLFKSIGDERTYFRNTANVTAEITSMAAGIADEQVDQTLRAKLQQIFSPRTNVLYGADIAILPALDEIKIGEDRPTLIILERSADKLPADFLAWWQKQDLQNRVLVLTADPNAVSTLRASARRMRAIDKVEERIRAQEGANSQQMTELQDVKTREAGGFTGALRVTFTTIMFPIKGNLRVVKDFSMTFESNDYDGEAQIVGTLAKTGKLIPSDKFEAKFEVLRQDAEEILFDADQVQESSLRRNAAIRPDWYWLPPNGLNELVKLCVQRGHWRQKNGLVAKTWERKTSVTAKTDEYGPNPIETGRFQIIVTPEDADIVYVSETGVPDPTTASKLDGRVYETAAHAAWFLAVDSKGIAKTGDPCEWRAPVRVKLDVKRNFAGFEIAVAACPRAASVRASFDNTDPRNAPVVPGTSFPAPADAMIVRVVAVMGQDYSAEESAVLGAYAIGGPKPKKPLKPDEPARLTSRFESRDTATAFKALDYLAGVSGGSSVLGGSVESTGNRGEQDFVTLRIGRDTAVPATDLDRLTKDLVAKMNVEQPTVKLRLDSVAFTSGRDLTGFCDALGQDFEQVTWEQE